MLFSYLDTLNNERIVEIEFIKEKLSSYPPSKILDVGGIPSMPEQTPYTKDLEAKHDISVCDFRGGKYKGDFVEALRIQDQKIESVKKPELTSKHEKWESCKQALLDGYTIGDLQQKYSISEENINLLNGQKDGTN